MGENLTNTRCSIWRCRCLWLRALPKVLHIFCPPIIVLLLIFGNCQWHPWIYSYQRWRKVAQNISQTTAHPLFYIMAEELYPPEHYTGTWKQFAFNGTVTVEIEYVNGIRNGLVTTWERTGQKKSETECRQGMRHGRTTKWHSNGEKWIEGSYVHDKREGIWKYWNMGGKLSRIEEWKGGCQIRSEIYLTKGLKKVILFNPQHQAKFLPYRIEGEIVKIEYWQDGTLIRTEQPDTKSL